jgi:hypothetical protein
MNDINLSDRYPGSRLSVDHDEIKQWAEKHQARPVLIDDPKAGSDEPMIRLDFPGLFDNQDIAPTKTKEIDWSEFFDLFEKLDLAFVFTDQTNPEDLSESFKFVKRAG